MILSKGQRLVGLCLV